MPLRVTRRPDTGALTIEGRVAGIRVRRRAGSDDPRLAREEAALLEAQLLRDGWHGRRPGAVGFAQAVLSYLDFQERGDPERKRLGRLLRHLGDVPLSSITQERVDAARAVLRPNPAPSTVLREVLTPLRAVLAHAAERGWCEAPRLKAPRQPTGRTLFLLPEEVSSLRDSAAPHLRPLIVFLACTGARMGEAMALDWRSVDLAGGRARFEADTTKGRKLRVAQLPPAAVAALAALEHREGRVFRTHFGGDFAEGEGAARVGTAWATACRKAGLPGDLVEVARPQRMTGKPRMAFRPVHTPHVLRHTWASWHYAVHRDLLLLKAEGGWASVGQVERYAHLMPEGQEQAVRAFRGEWTAGHEVVTARNRRA